MPICGDVRSQSRPFPIEVRSGLRRSMTSCLMQGVPSGGRRVVAARSRGRCQDRPLGETERSGGGIWIESGAAAAVFDSVVSNTTGGIPTLAPRRRMTPECGES
jgi:hypothetical protein